MGNRVSSFAPVKVPSSADMSMSGWTEAANRTSKLLCRHSAKLRLEENHQKNHLERLEPKWPACESQPLRVALRPALCYGQSATLLSIDHHDDIPRPTLAEPYVLIGQTPTPRKVPGALDPPVGILLFFFGQSNAAIHFAVLLANRYAAGLNPPRSGQLTRQYTRLASRTLHLD